MQILFSPAKKQLYGDWQEEFPEQEPIFKNEISTLNQYLRSKSVADLADIMHISAKLAELNYNRIHSFKDTWGRVHTGPAILSFAGDAYKSLEAKTLTLPDLLWANNHIYIISGLYGLLRPLDPLQYYRLEMKTKLAGFQYDNLYDFWGNRLSDKVNKERIISLASIEYAKAVQIPGMICIDFKEKCLDGYRTIGVQAKRARGSMLRWIIVNRISDAEQLKTFDLGYVFEKKLSEEHHWVFVSKCY